MALELVGLVFVGLLGLAVGSFLNVVIYRVPRGESLIKPGSHCPACQHPIQARHNVPVLSWFVLRGRCADCGAPISVRYPVVELVTGLLFVAVAWQLAQLDLLSALPAYLYFTATGMALAVIDLQVRRLPNAIVVPSYAVVAALLGLSAIIEGDWWALGRAGIGAAILLGGFYALAFFYAGAMGMGDVRLSGLIGAVLGYVSWSALVVGTFAGFFLGASVGVALMVAGRGTRKTALPFGPFMVAGVLVGLFAGAALAELYRSTLQL